MKNRSNSWSAAELIGLVILLLIVAGLIFGVVNALKTNTVENCQVEDKDRTTNGDGGSEARIYTENCGVLRVNDSLLSWTWSSADTYASIDKGKTYDFTTRGLRVPFLSMFPNIVEAEEK